MTFYNNQENRQGINHVTCTQGFSRFKPITHKFENFAKITRKPLEKSCYQLVKTEIHSAEKINHIIDLAWADDVSFDVIEKRLGVAEKDVILIMRSNLKPKSFKVWRERVAGRKAKHQQLLRLSSKKQLSHEASDIEETI